MALSPDQAADSLKEIEQTAWRSASAYRYRKVSPYFFLWGLVYMAGYGGTDFYPRYANLIWLVLLLLAMGISTWLGRRQFGTGEQAAGATGAWRYPVAFVIVWAFIVATYAVMGGHPSPAQQGAFPPLMIATIYMVCGLWRRTRLLVTGIALAVLTLVGFRLHEHFLLWEGFAGGGALILAGLWLRKV